MKPTILLLLALMLALPGMAMGTEAQAPAFAYYEFDQEAGSLLTLQDDRAQKAGGLFILDQAYLSLAYHPEDAYDAPLADGDALTCLNADLSVRWELSDERLIGAQYVDLVELPDALLLGEQRKLAGAEGKWAPSLMLLDKYTGEIRWQLEEGLGGAITDFQTDENGAIYVTSHNGLIAYPENPEEAVGGCLSQITEDGRILWTQDYLESHQVLQLTDVCPMGDDGLVLYGMRSYEDKIVLYTDRQGLVRGWFTFQPRTGEDEYLYTSLRLVTADDGAVYLAGQEMKANPLQLNGAPAFEMRSLDLMRLSAEAFQGGETAGTEPDVPATEPIGEEAAEEPEPQEAPEQPEEPEEAA